jgi:hypothetical protein
MIKDCFTLFTSYAGAVCVQDGVELLEDWVWQMVYPQESDTRPDHSDDSHEEDSLFVPSAKSFKSESINISDSSSSFRHLVLPPPVENMPFLPTFNEFISKIPVDVTFQTWSKGPPHAVVWYATCISERLI